MNYKLKIDAIIFDLDGTLIDSRDIYFKVLEEIFSRLNLPLVSKEIILEIMRKSSKDWGDLFSEETEERRARLVNEAKAIFKEVFPRMFRKDNKMIPGAGKIIRQISSEGVKVGMVTSTHFDYLDGKLDPLKKTGIYDLIESIVCIEDTPKFKPEPDPLIECARRLGVSMDKSVYVGDSCVDIRAGRAAGMKTVGVLTGMDSYETLKKEDPDVIMDSVADLLKMLRRI